ncbi:Uncharacterised protein [Mycobacteroides abscessus subsp. abscessus]|nr:Uncharacterised protein [Mycobacteroides abscessus subsp. abscessus]
MPRNRLSPSRFQSCDTAAEAGCGAHSEPGMSAWAGRTCNQQCGEWRLRYAAAESSGSHVLRERQFGLGSHGMRAWQDVRAHHHDEVATKIRG